MIVDLLIQFGLAIAATFGFAVIFRAPLNRIPACILVGGFGWVAYLLTFDAFDSPVVGCFVGACVVGLLSDICSRTLKDAATIFIIPGILCLVPGSKIFYTMEALLQKDFTDTAQVGFEMLMMAGAIAMGLLVMGAVIRVIRSVIRKTVSLKEFF